MNAVLLNAAWFTNAPSVMAASKEPVLTPQSTAKQWLRTWSKH